MHMDNEEITETNQSDESFFGLGKIVIAHLLLLLLLRSHLENI